MKKIINLLEQPLEIKTDPRLVGSDEFISLFPSGTVPIFGITDKIPLIEISLSTSRTFVLNKDNSQLIIEIPEKDFFASPTNQMFMFQFIFRFWALNYFDKGFLLLHGSTVITENQQTVLFGDMSGNTGKTLSSVEIGLTSLKYVVDEFTLYDVNNNLVHGFDFVPLHLRVEVRNHLNSYHGIRVDKEFVLGKSLGFNHKNPSRLNLICYTVFDSNQKCKVVRLDNAKSLQAFLICATAHISKLLNPHLDRLYFLNNTDSCSQATTEIFDSALPNIEGVAQRIIKNIPSFQLRVTNPCEIPKLVNEISF